MHISIYIETEEILYYDIDGNWTNIGNSSSKATSLYQDLHMDRWVKMEIDTMENSTYSTTKIWPGIKPKMSIAFLTHAVIILSVIVKK